MPLINIHGVDLERIAIGDALATRDAIALLAAKLEEEALIRARDDRRTTDGPLTEWHPLLLALANKGDELIFPHRQIARHVRAYRATDQTISTGTFTKVQLATESVDVYAEFDSATNYRFTGKAQGDYLCTANIRINGCAGRVITLLYLNGAAVAANVMAVDTQDCSPCVADVIALNGSTDYVEVYVWHESGADRTLVGGSDDSWLDIIYLGH